MGNKSIFDLRGLAYLLVLMAIPPSSVAATDPCTGNLDEELRFAAEPAKDDEARSRFQQECSQSELGRNKIKCGDESRSACYCQHMELRRQARHYISRSRQACAQTTAAARAAACNSNSNAETCQRSNAGNTALAARSETEMAQQAGQARQSADAGKQQVTREQRAISSELGRAIVLSDEDLRGPVPRGR